MAAHNNILVLTVLASGLLASCAQSGSRQRPAASAKPQYDLLISNASVVDGTGAPAYRASVLIDGDTIAAIDRSGSAGASATRVIDAGGRTLAPGFIDMHGHGDPIEKSYENFLAMGVTTVVLGQDGGSVQLAESESVHPFSQWAAAAERAG